MRRLGVRIVSAFTATASPEVTECIRAQLYGDEDVRVVGENADRPGITYAVTPVLCLQHALTGLVRAAEHPLLVFCRTWNDTEVACRSARRTGGNHHVYFYHAGLSREERSGVEAWFIASRDGTLFTTCAYGDVAETLILSRRESKIDFRTEPEMEATEPPLGSVPVLLAGIPVVNLNQNMRKIAQGLYQAVFPGSAQGTIDRGEKNRYFYGLLRITSDSIISIRRTGFGWRIMTEISVLI